MNVRDIHGEELCALDATELGRRYRSGLLSPVEVTKATLERIAQLDPQLNVYLSVMAEPALAAAKSAELQLEAGIDLGPLHGIPVCVKDNIRVRGSRTTAASRVLKDASLDLEDAPVANRLRRAGAVLMGKASLIEFAFASHDRDGPFKDVQNPRKLGHQAGSSSTGSAAAVAAGMAVISLGTDSGGSVRHPASVCGVVGLKPTYGLVPCRGVIPVSVHLDHVGPMARSVTDVAAALTAIAGHDPGDPFSILAPIPDYVAALGGDVTGLRLGLPTNSFYQFGQPAALLLVQEASDLLQQLGLAPVHLEVPLVEESNDVADLINAVDVCVYHERHQGQRSLYGQNFLARAQLGQQTSAVDYAKARSMQADIRREWLRLFERVDILAMPANVGIPPSIGEETIEVGGEQYPTRRVNSRYNRVSNLTGFPALTIPIGEMMGGFPIGIQLVGPPLGEARLLAVGYALEQAIGNFPSRWGIDPRN